MRIRQGHQESEGRSYVRRGRTDAVALAEVAISILAVGFVATAIGAVWTTLSPVDGGVNFAAGFLFTGGMAIGVVGLVMGVVALVSGRAERRRAR